MNLDIQFKLKSNPEYIQFIRRNSSWYKLLTREPNEFKNFETTYKDFIKNVRSQRLTRTLEYIEMFQSILSSMK